MERDLFFTSEGSEPETLHKGNVSAVCLSVRASLKKTCSSFVSEVLLFAFGELPMLSPSYQLRKYNLHVDNEQSWPVKQLRESSAASSPSVNVECMSFLHCYTSSRNKSLSRSPD